MACPYHSARTAAIRVLPCYPPQRRRCAASTCRRTCASPGADVRTRQGPPTCAAVRRNVLRGERVRLRIGRQGRIRFPPVCRQTKRHVCFPDGNFRVGGPLSARTVAHAQQRATRGLFGPNQSTAAHFARSAGDGRRGPPPSLRCRMPPASSRVTCMRRFHSPARGSSCSSTRASRTTTRGDERRSQQQGVYASSALKAERLTAAREMPLMCGADSQAAAGTVRGIVSMGGNSWKTPRKISCATST